MSWIRSLITLILVSLLVSVGCSSGSTNSGRKIKPVPKEVKEQAYEPRGPGGGEMK